VWKRRYFCPPKTSFLFQRWLRFKWPKFNMGDGVWLWHHVHFVVEIFHLYGIVNWCIVYICIILTTMWHTFLVSPNIWWRIEIKIFTQISGQVLGFQNLGRSWMIMVHISEKIAIHFMMSSNATRLTPKANLKLQILISFYIHFSFCLFWICCKLQVWFMSCK
jgi:hypothetical protein